MSDLTPEERFASWLRREIPPGTVIGNPDWWAPRLWRAVERARLAQQEGEGSDTLCDDCGHPESWHTGSFTSCNHPSNGWCHCEGYVAPTPKDEDTGHE